MENTVQTPLLGGRANQDVLDDLKRLAKKCHSQRNVFKGRDLAFELTIVLLVTGLAFGYFLPWKRDFSLTWPWWQNLPQWFRDAAIGAAISLLGIFLKTAISGNKRRDELNNAFNELKKFELMVAIHNNLPHPAVPGSDDDIEDLWREAQEQTEKILGEPPRVSCKFSCISALSDMFEVKGVEVPQLPSPSLSSYKFLTDRAVSMYKMFHEHELKYRNCFIFWVLAMFFVAGLAVLIGRVYLGQDWANAVQSAACLGAASMLWYLGYALWRWVVYGLAARSARGLIQIIATEQNQTNDVFIKHGVSLQETYDTCNRRWSACHSAERTLLTSIVERMIRHLKTELS